MLLLIKLWLQITNFMLINQFLLIVIFKRKENLKEKPKRFIYL
jgi:hypothetical protein